MKKILILFAGVILSVSMAQARESSLNSLFEEPGKRGVLKQLAAISNAVEKGKNGLSQGETADNCPGSVQSGPLTKQTLAPSRLPCKSRHEFELNSIDLRCQFAYDLHRFVAGKGRDYDSVLTSGSNSAHGARRALPAYLPYLEQEGFANGWWATKSKRFRESGAENKKLFLHEAIVYATNLYGQYGQRVYGTAAYVAWEEGAVQAVLKKH